MKNKLGALLAVLAMMLAMTGCGAKVDRTTLHIKNGGKVVENVAEDFGEQNYDENELKDFIQEEVEKFQEESGKGSIKSSGFSVEDGKAYVTLKFNAPSAYAEFHKETLYVGTMVQAVAAGYTLPEELYPVEDGKVKDTATDQKVDESDEYSVVITSESLDVHVPGKVAYVSRAGLKVKDGDTVSVEKENEDDTSLTYIVYK